MHPIQVFVSLSDTIIELPAPAKINLMLSVNGRRKDGFHSLVSLVAPLAFGDVLRVGITQGEDRLHCSERAVSAGPENLILRAAVAYRKALGRAVFFRFELEKCIPMGAGFGGGSSDAAVALRGMNQLLGEPLSQERLFHISAGIGSDCPFFIEPKVALMSGRGEVIESVCSAFARRLHGRKLLLFRPDFEVDTRWAYGRLSDGAPDTFEPEATAKARLANFEKNGDWRQLLFNSFEKPVGDKYLSLPVLLTYLRSAGVDCLMSGSGSGSFALYENGQEAAFIMKSIRDAWGGSVFLVETSIA